MKKDGEPVLFYFILVSRKNLFYPSFSWFQEKEAKRRKKPSALPWCRLGTRVRIAPHANFHCVKIAWNHAIGHDMRTLYIALALRASTVRAEIASTRRMLPTSRCEFGFAQTTTQRLVPERSQNSLTARRFILNSLPVQKPHRHQTEFDVKALNLQGFYSFCNFFL